MFTLRTKISLLKALGSKNLPFYVQFYVSKACYLKCKMCHIVEANADMTPVLLKDIGSLADNLVKIGAGVVLLTGGEPFLRGDIDEIVGSLKSRGLDVRLQTAGLYAAREKIARCFSLGVRDINVSLDSLDENLSDYINGVGGSWRNAIRTIGYISRVSSARGSLCALGCVLSPYNLGEIEAVLDFATQIGWWLSLVPAHITTTSAAMNFRGCDAYFQFTPEDFPAVRSLIGRLKVMKRQGFNLFDSDRYLDSSVHFIETGKPDWRHKDLCDTPNLYFAILPDGRFAPCCDFRLNETIYVYDSDFPKTYRSEAFRQKVRDVARRCPGCQFGSFPEISLSFRHPMAFLERAFLFQKTRTRGIKPFEEEALLKLISSLKEKYPIYQKQRLFKIRDAKLFLKRNP
jgi:MoaA/NifB/PqqE/SkfB family radical SAM enzyme